MVGEGVFIVWERVVSVTAYRHQVLIFLAVWLVAADLCS